MMPPAGVKTGPFHLAAAVMAAFDPDTLKPLGETREGDLGRLLEDSAVEDLGEESVWTLTNGARRKALAVLGTKESMKAALAANPGDAVPHAARSRQAKIGQWLDGTIPNEATLELEDLREWRQVLEWFGAFEANPELDRRLARAVKVKEVLQPFHQLSEHFQGRREELALLDQALFRKVKLPAALSAQLPMLSIVRKVFGWMELVPALLAGGWLMRWLLRLLRRKPIMVYGPGGVGKSSLIAKFIVDSVHERGALFVYLDFDQQGLMTETPWLALEAIEQLRWQLPDREEALSRSAAVLKNAIKKSGSFTGDLRLELTGSLALPGGLAGLDRPLLLVLDTFEEVQKRGKALQEAILEFVDGISESLPAICTVIVGRDALPESKATLIRLKELEWPAAEAYLIDRGIAGPKTRQVIYDHVGGTPLNLRLAATLVLREGEAGLQEASIDRELIAGRLYRRILAHIDQDEVRKIAHPGLVLRRITPELIAQVLATPCGLSGMDEATAERLFVELGRQVDLVTVEGGALRHRQDVRKDMLRLLRAERGETTRQIEELAVRYYSTRTEPSERAEEIYHLLSLGCDPSTLDSRWRDEFARYLRSAVEELDGPARSWLAARVGGPIGEEAAAEADLETWERYAARTVSDYLGAGKVDNAIATLNERRDRSANSPLREIEVEALVRHCEVQTAYQVAWRGLLSSDPLPFAIRCAELEPKVMDKPLPVASADRFEELAAANPSRPIEVATLGVQLLANYEDQLDVAKKLAAQLHGFLLHQPNSVFFNDPTLLRRVAAQIGELYPAMAGRILALGLDEALTVRLRPHMSGVLAAWERDAAQREAFQAAGPAEAEKMLDRWFAQGPLPDAVAVGFSNLLKQHWLIPEREQIDIRSKFRVAANSWRRNREPAFLLSSEDLGNAERFDDLSPSEADFLRASREHRAQVLLAKAEKAKRWSRRNALIASGAALWGLVGFLQTWSAKNAREQLKKESEEKTKALGELARLRATLRPALLVRGGRVDDPPEHWRMSNEVRHRVELAARAVGRVEAGGNQYGTAFLVDEDLVLTLIESVASPTAGATSPSGVWNSNGSIRVNFRAEHQATAPSSIATSEVVWMASKSPGLQPAAFRLAQAPFPRVANAPLRIETKPSLQPGTPVYMVSHPRRDARSVDEVANLKLADAASGVKRVQPGFVTAVGAFEIGCDCFAPDGSEGAPILDLRTHRVVALHLGGGVGRLLGPIAQELSFFG